MSTACNLYENFMIHLSSVYFNKMCELIFFNIIFAIFKRTIIFLTRKILEMFYSDFDQSL